MDTATHKGKISTEEFDRMVEAGEDVIDHIDPSGTKKVLVDFPIWMILGLDREADRLGVARQALIKMMIAQRLDEIEAAGNKKRQTA